MNAKDSEMNPDSTKLIFRSNIETPINHSTVFVNYWWCYHSDRGAVFFKLWRNNVSPQCNQSQELAEAIRKKLYPWAELRFVPLAFVEANQYGYVIREKGIKGNEHENLHS